MHRQNRPAPVCGPAPCAQLKSAAAQLSNLFWEPSLTAKVPPSLRTQFLRHWPVVLLAGLMLAGVATAHYFSIAHLLFLPFYLVPCALLTWKIDRRWGALAATAAAVAGPLIANAKQPGYLKLDVMVWNMAMRFITLQLCVLFVEQIHRQKKLSQHRAAPDHRPVKFTESWAVVLASGLLFLTVAALDFVTDPRMTFMPLYLLPCMILTLVLISAGALPRRWWWRLPLADGIFRQSQLRSGRGLRMEFRHAPCHLRALRHPALTASAREISCSFPQP